MCRVAWLWRYAFLGFYLNDWNIQWMFHPLLVRILSPALCDLQNVHSTHVSLIHVLWSPLASPYVSSFSAKDLTGHLYRSLERLLSPTLLNFTHLSSPHLQGVPPKLRDMMCSIWAPSAMLWGFSGGSMVKNPPANTGDVGDAGSIPESGRSLGVENGNPLQYSCLGNPVDRGVSWATVHGVTKSLIQLSDWVHTHTHTYLKTT